MYAETGTAVAPPLVRRLSRTVFTRCGEPTCCKRFEIKRGTARFCSTLCRRTYQHRTLARGALAYELVYAWRKTRGSKKGSLGDIGNLVDRWVREDRIMREAAMGSVG